jgi:hypothetical protein
VTPATLRRLPDDGNASTVLSAARGSRERERFRRSRLAARERGGWSGDGAGVLQVCIEELVWLRIEARQGDQEVHRVVAKRIGERGRTRAHGRRRIRADALADMVDSGERFLPPGGISAREKRGCEGGGGGGFIGAETWGEG